MSKTTKIAISSLFLAFAMNGVTANTVEVGASTDGQQAVKEAIQTNEKCSGKLCGSKWIRR